MKNTLFVIVMAGLLAAAILLVLYVSAVIGDVTISTHGAVALGLGIVFSIAIGGGLMFLVFYSARKGHDDAQNRHEDQHQDPSEH